MRRVHAGVVRLRRQTGSANRLFPYIVEISQGGNGERERKPVDGFEASRESCENP
jgi:hypothetical protein